MSLHYIIDGYNVIKNSFFSSAVNLNESRLSLIRFIEDKKPQGSLKNKVTIIFDGSPGVSGPAINSICEVFFTKGESADEKIKRLVSASPNPRTVIVVTDDREIRLFIRAIGAHPLGTKEFLAKAIERKRPDNESPKAHISYTKAAQITAELKKIWLK